MKLLRASKDVQIFHLSLDEKHLLLDVLKLYPLVPAAHHRLSKGGDATHSDENQRLLEAALAEQRQENCRQVLAMVNEPERLRETKGGCELSLTPAQMEWLLQVLNDVRVGSWLALGAPEQGQELAVTTANAKYQFALEVCGIFESLLLSALGVQASSRWAED